MTDADDSCTNDVCTCTISGSTYEVQQGRVQLETSRSSGVGGPQPGEGFGLHLVNCSTNPQPGGMSTSAVEAEFASKLGDMSSYDAFMDYNVALYTTQLDSYISAFDADGVDYLATTWTDQSDDYYGIIVHVPNTQMVIELMSLNSTLLARRAAAGNKPTVHAFAPHERRASASALARAIAAAEVSATNILTVISVSRASSDLSAIDDFYSTGMQCSTTLSVDTDGYSKRCYLWDVASATADVCFTKRKPTETAGSFKVSDFEDMLNAVHANAVADDCGNKWVDNHYAVDGRSGSADYIADYIESSGAFFYCSGDNPHYIIDPSGFGIQLDLQFSGSSTVCTSAREARRRAAAAAPLGFLDAEAGANCPCTSPNPTCGGTGF